MAEEKLLVKRDGEFCYPIYFENDFSFLSQALTDEGLAGKSMCIVSDSTVAPLYADQVKAELLKVSDHVCQFTFPAGEAYKNLDTVQDLFQCLIENGLDPQKSGGCSWRRSNRRLIRLRCRSLSSWN